MLEANAPALYSIQAERDILGTCLMEPGYIPRIALLSDDYHDARHRKLWGVMLALHQSGGTVSIDTVTEILLRQGTLEELGGTVYLNQLAMGAGYVTAETNARIVADYAIRRRAIEQAQQLATQALDLSVNFQERQAAIANTLATNARALSQAVPLSQWMESSAAQIEQAYNRTPPPPILSGFADLDNILEGFRPGMCIITGKPGLGKTILVENISRNAAKQAAGAFYSFEMSQEDMSYRILSGETGVKVSAMLTGDLKDEQFTQLLEAGAALGKQALYVSDTPMTIAQLQADLTRLKITHGIRWFVLDYLELLADEFPGLQGFERTGILSRHLARLCRELNLVGFIVQRMNKSGMSKLADMDSLAGSAEVVYHAAYIITMVEYMGDNGETDPRMRTLLIKKARFLEGNKPLSCDLRKNPDKPQFESVYQPKGAKK